MDGYSSSVNGWRVESKFKSRKSTVLAPRETEELYGQMAAFLDTFATDDSGNPMRVGRTGTGRPRHFKIGSYKWGVYAFYDYDNEPIYVGQTNESLRTRIRRHLTNQRTDAVAMSVLDPFEVREVAVWPLPQFEGVSGDERQAAKLHLDALERLITRQAIQKSSYYAILNEKNPPEGDLIVDEPKSYRGTIISETVLELRSHPDSRIARRAMITARLAQVVSERKVQGGLRRVLATQAKRLEAMAHARFIAAGGEASVETKTEEKDGDSGIGDYHSLDENRSDGT